MACRKRRGPRRCIFEKCPRFTCRNGQRLVHRKGACCSRCEGNVISRCRNAACPSIKCHRGQKLELKGCCARCVHVSRKRKAIKAKIVAEVVTGPSKRELRKAEKREKRREERERRKGRKLARRERRVEREEEEVRMEEESSEKKKEKKEKKEEKKEGKKEGKKEKLHARRRRSRRHRHHEKKEVHLSKRKHAAQLAKLRRSLRLERAKALRCGDIDTKCIDRVYEKIASISRQIAKLNKRHAHVRGLSARKCSTSSRARRNVLKQITRCADDDSQCVKRLFRRVAHITRKQSHKCKRKERKEHKKRKEHKERVTVRKSSVDSNPWAIKNVNWRQEYTCTGLKKSFNKWLRRQHKIRAYFLNEANECEGSDTTCLRAFYKKVSLIHAKIRHNRGLYVQYISRCDSCQALKLRFMRWRAHQKAEITQLHLEMRLCASGDHKCLQIQVDRIKAIQTEIHRRLKEILALHTDCVFSANITVAPTGPNRSSGAMASASVSALLLAVAIAAIVTIIA